MKVFKYMRKILLFIVVHNNMVYCYILEVIADVCLSSNLCVQHIYVQEIVRI